MMRASKIGLAVALSVLSAAADAMPRDGFCALIVASRSSLPEVDLFELQNPQLKVEEVYEAENGWLAISVGDLPLEGNRQRLDSLKGSGAIPEDSYCSTGRSYVREVRSASMPSAPAAATPDTSFAAPFDARPMDPQEKRFLQSALAYLGYYSGVLDGEWGQGSQRALETFALATVGSEATNADAAFLMMIALEQYQHEGWQYRHFGQYGLSVILPTATLEVDGSDGKGLALDDPTTGISVYLTRGNAADVGSYHQRFEVMHDGTAEIYRIREADRWITAASWEGEAHYLSSESFDGAWTSVFVSALPAPGPPSALWWAASRTTQVRTSRCLRTGMRGVR